MNKAEVKMQSNSSITYNRMVQSAIKLKDGRILIGMRHGTIARIALLCGLSTEDFSGSIQGFVDRKDVFYSRKQAIDQVLGSGQLTHDEYDGGILTSEDLW